MQTLNDMISATLGDDVMSIGSVLPTVDVETVKIAEDKAQATEVDLDEAEKLASVCEFIASRGVSSFLVKEAMGACPKCKAKCAPGSKKCDKCGCELEKKAAAGGGSPETNAGHHLKDTVKKQVKPHKDAPPMSQSSHGATETNAGKKPGGGREVDTAGKGLGAKHSALGSNESAIAYSKKEKAKQVSSSLKAVLDQAAFADPKLKELLDNTESDKNIHSKKASAGGSPSREAIMQELARRTLAKQAQEA